MIMPSKWNLKHFQVIASSIATYIHVLHFGIQYSIPSEKLKVRNTPVVNDTGVALIKTFNRLHTNDENHLQCILGFV